MIGEVHAVDHQRHQFKPAQIAPQQFASLRAVPSTKRLLTALLPVPCTQSSPGRRSSFRGRDAG